MFFGVVLTAGVCAAEPDHSPDYSGPKANWAGYVASGNGPYRSVAATWVQPGVSCGAETSKATFWVGMDGFGSRTVQQIGTKASCLGGQARHEAFFEFYPAPEQILAGPVAPGDVITAAVTWNYGRFTLTVRNQTVGWQHEQSREIYPQVARPVSAEVVVEAPVRGKDGPMYPLANFDTVSFTDVEVNGLPMGQFGPTRLDKASAQTVQARTLELREWRDFSVAWVRP